MRHEHSFLMSKVDAMLTEWSPLTTSWCTVWIWVWLGIRPLHRQSEGFIKTNLSDHGAWVFDQSSSSFSDKSRECYRYWEIAPEGWIYWTW
jgi:hypothetical protein